MKSQMKSQMTSLNLSEWALKHRQMIAFLLLLLTITGHSAYSHLGQKEDPEFTIKTMVVQAYWPGKLPAPKTRKTLQTHFSITS